MKLVAILLLTSSLMWTAEPASKGPIDINVHGLTAGGSMLPSEATAKSVLNSTSRHGDWHEVPAGSVTIRTFVVFPDRADTAPVVIVSEDHQGLSDWLRAVADQAAQEGFIALVPDLAIEKLGPAEMKRRMNAVRDYAVKLPGANGKSVSVGFNRDVVSDSRIEAIVEGTHKASFRLTERAWPEVIAFLNEYTENHPTLISLPPHSHMGHEPLGLMAAAQRGGGQDAGDCRAGSLGCKRDDIVAGFNTAKSTLARSPMRVEWVDLPVGNAKVHTRVTYPKGSGKAPIIIVMSGANGLNDWQQAVGDQLAREGFIAIAPDVHSGLGPNGGNFESFEFPDDVVKAGARITTQEATRRYKAAWDYGMKLPQANGKSASIGFCGGGTRSFAFAGEVPELNAAVVYYGTGPDEATVAKIKAPVLGLYGEIDARIVSTVQPTATLMQKLGKVYEPHIYKDATHAFLQYQNLGGNEEATADAWPRTIAFLNQHTK